MKVKKLRRGTKSVIRFWKRYRRPSLIELACFVALLTAWSLFVPQAITFDYSKQATCVRSLRFFPRLSHTDTAGAFRVYRPAKLSIGKLVIYSNLLCAAPKAAPTAKQPYHYQERLFNWRLFEHRLTVVAPSYPRLDKVMTSGQNLPPDAAIELILNTPDATFTYAVTDSTKTAPCRIKDTRLHCDLRPLQLSYAAEYKLTVARRYKQQAAATLQMLAIRTITPTSIVSTSVAAGATVQAKPRQFVITTDKPLANIGQVALIAKGAEGQESMIATDTAFADTAITVTAKQDLPRKTLFEIRVSSVRAKDGSGLAGTSYSLPFNTSGGPKVSGVNVGSRGLSPNPTIIISFDQTLLAGQDVAKHVGVRVNGVHHAVTVSTSGSKLSIKPAANLPPCGSLTITIDSSLQSQYGISGDSAWTFKSRAICYSTFSIGRSVRGRAITAYKFGNGSDLIVFMGAMHGNEANSKQLMDEWIRELDAHPERIPAHRTIVVIPSVNPDGVTSGSRFNASGVDLNRNFPANDWKSIVTTPNNSQPSAAGGSAPLSEPESQAVADYLRQNHPRLVMSYHSKAAIVEANEAGDSVTIALTYGTKARYRAIPKSQSAPVFHYDTTGAMEDWLRDTYGWPALVVELASSTSSEFSRNRDAMWHVAGL